MSQPVLGEFILFEHPNYTGRTRKFAVKDFVAGVVHSFSGTDLQDRASAVRWCLSPGQVVTLTDHNRQPRLPDLSEVGRTVDLIGDGTVCGKNLDNQDASDCLSAFFWRHVDLSRGRVIFYKDGSYKNFQQTIFIAEWAVNKAHNISKWAIHDRMSSVQWVDLDPRVIVELYDHTNGGGSSYRNIMRRAEPGVVEGIPSLGTYGMQDKVSSFKIVEQLPVVEEIDAIEFDRRQFPRRSVTIDSKGSVQGTAAASTYIASVSTTWTETSTVSVAQSHSTGGQFGYTYSSGAGSFAKHTVSVTLSYNYTNTRTDTASSSKAIEVSHHQSYPIPPNHSWKFKLMVVYDEIEVPFTTQATRWYAQPLSGTVADSTKVPNRTLYRRVEVVRGVLKGSFHFETTSSFVTTPL